MRSTDSIWEVKKDGHSLPNHSACNYDCCLVCELEVASGARPDAIDPGRKAAALAQNRTPEGMSEDEQIIYRFCTELQRKRSASDDTYGRALAKFEE